MPRKLKVMNYSQALMKRGRSIRICLGVITVLAISTTLILVAPNTSAQSPVGRRDIPAPSQDTFASADGVITLKPSGGKTISLDTIRLYNGDGTLWYEFSLDRDHPLYYKLHSKPDFKPFAPLDTFKIAMRLKAASRNWYEVIIDDKNLETKYIWVGEFLLRRESFEKYVLISSFVIFDREKNALRETPDGHIKGGHIPASEEFTPVRIKGEWLLVEIIGAPRIVPRVFGWIRWKEDREILIGFMLNCKECV